MSEPRPPDDIPAPEVPKKGFNVEVRQPEMLYKLAQEIVKGDAESFQAVSNTEINGSIISKELTDLVGIENDYGIKNIGRQSKNDGTYHLSSVVVLSSDLINGENHGYFSYNQVAKINQLLVEKGIRASFETDVFEEGKSRIKIERDGYFYELFLGFPNRETEEKYIRTNVEQESSENRNDYYTRFELPKIAKGLVRERVSFTSIDRDRYETGREGYPKLEDEASFTRSLNTYADVYQHVLTAIYESEGKSPPDKSIIIRPPIKSEDTLTKISSTSTESPITVTEAQLQTESIGFEDIAGQEAAVEEAKRLVLAINHPEVFEKRGVKRPKGILFYGPPGTGKTLIAKAVAKEAKADFLQVSAADIGTKWYGESEKLMQEVFNIANKAVAEGRKVVLFFDEIDSLAPSREDSHEATRKVVATLLQNMDGMKANPNVTVLAATNRPQDIDAALKRPGRLDKIIHVPNPSAEGRVAVLKVHMDKAIKAAQDSGNMFSADINLNELGQVTDGMSPADLANLVNLTLEDKTMAELQGNEWTPVTTEEMIHTAKRLGLLKEEKRKIGFIQPEQNGVKK